jgi:hypothetical protein
LLAIAQNPHSKNPKDLWDMLDNGGTKKTGSEFNKTSFENFKAIMSKNPKFIVK